MLENDQEVETEETKEETKEEDTEETTEEEKEEKPQLTPEQKQAIKQRNFKKLAKELGYEIEESKPEKKEEKENKSEFDYGELAFLAAKSVSEEDHDYLLREVKTTGKPLKELLRFKYVQEELESAKTEREKVDATPKGSKRGTPSGKDTVDYWRDKEGLPEDSELKKKVLAARLKREQDKGI